MSFKRTKVVMLPTNEKAEIGFLTQKGKERGHLVHFDRPMPIILDSENQHLYFLSDDEIKVGDWCYDEYNKVIFKNNSIGTPGASKKIIATTDRLEIPYQFDKWSIIPQPSEGFIQKFVDSYNSGDSITEADVEYISNLEQIGSEDDEYFEKLKINPKDNTITIKKLKDTWTRDEIVNLLQQFNNDKSGVFDCTKWIEENL